MSEYLNLMYPWFKSELRLPSSRTLHGRFILMSWYFNGTYAYSLRRLKSAIGLCTNGHIMYDSGWCKVVCTLLSVTDIKIRFACCENVYFYFVLYVIFESKLWFLLLTHLRKSSENVWQHKFAEMTKCLQKKTIIIIIISTQYQKH